MTGTREKRVQKPLDSNSGRAATFKYYIHDTAAGYSLEMSGPFTASSVPELSCCWETAKTTLRNRTLTLDVRKLTSVDEPARQWLVLMNQEGAKYLPASYLQGPVQNPPDGTWIEPQRVNLFVRLAHALRGGNQTSTVKADSVRVTGR